MRAKRRAPAIAAATVAASIAGCGVTKDLPADPTGSVDIGFVVSDRLSLSSMDYMVQGNGFGPVSGTIDLGDRNSNISANVGGMPTGTGYQLTLQGVTDDQGTFCGGSAQFDVVAPAASQMTLSMICVNANTIRTLTQDGVAHTCPAVASVAVSQAGGVITLSGSAYMFDAAPVSYRWEATGGALSQPDAATSTYACDSPGPQSLRFTAFDSFCADLALLNVTCP